MEGKGVWPKLETGHRDSDIEGGIFRVDALAEKGVAAVDRRGKSGEGLRLVIQVKPETGVVRARKGDGESGVAANG